MRHEPSFEHFQELAQGSSVVPVYRRLIGDALTPVAAFYKIQEGDWSFLFESVVGGERIGRYSFIGSGPFLCFEAYGSRVVLTDLRPNPPKREELVHSNPLKYLEDLLTRYHQAHIPADMPRFMGGAVGYAGYDSVRYLEELPNPPTDDRQLPDLCFAFYDRMVIFDHINKTVLVVAHAHVGATDLQESYRGACERVDRLVERLQRNVADVQTTDIAPGGSSQRTFTSNFHQPEFEAAVERAREYIFAGDIFQVVLSQRLRTETTARPFDIYRALRVLNPSPFMFFLRTGTTCLIGSSPEVMVRVVGDQVTVRPLAGTRPRGATPEADRDLEVELLADPKERAEHIMLVDLGRNDIGRVSQFGTVEIPDLMLVERYSHVMHISSTVTGRLKPGTTALDALRYCLPAGTLSGAPKVRAMEIIDELERHRRGPYGGAVGYIDFSGNMDTCIALRTLVLMGQTAYLQAGAGIVADSVPATEYAETLAKAMGLLRAIDVAETQL